jgi:hypothetical protein
VVILGPIFPYNYPCSSHISRWFLELQSSGILIPYPNPHLLLLILHIFFYSYNSFLKVLIEMQFSIYIIYKSV